MRVHVYANTDVQYAVLQQFARLFGDYVPRIRKGQARLEMPIEGLDLGAHGFRRRVARERYSGHTVHECGTILSYRPDRAEWQVHSVIAKDLDVEDPCDLQHHGFVKRFDGLPASMWHNEDGFIAVVVNEADNTMAATHRIIAEVPDLPWDTAPSQWVTSKYPATEAELLATGKILEELATADNPVHISPYPRIAGAPALNYDSALEYRLMVAGWERKPDHEWYRNGVTLKESKQSTGPKIWVWSLEQETITWSRKVSVVRKPCTSGPYLMLPGEWNQETKHLMTDTGTMVRPHATQFCDGWWLSAHA